MSQAGGGATSVLAPRDRPCSGGRIGEDVGRVLDATGCGRGGPKCVWVWDKSADSAEIGVTETHFGPTLRRTPSRQHQTRVFPDFPAPTARTRLVSWRLIPCRSDESQPGRAESEPIRTHTVALETENRREPHNLCGYKQENGRISLDHGGGAQGVQIFDVLVEEQVVELVDA